MQMFVPIDYGVTDIVIVVRASNATLSITKPDGKTQSNSHKMVQMCFKFR